MLQKCLDNRLLHGRAYRRESLHISEHSAVGSHAEPYAAYVSGTHKSAARAKCHKHLCEKDHGVGFRYAVKEHSGSYEDEGWDHHTARTETVKECSSEELEECESPCIGPGYEGEMPRVKAQMLLNIPLHVGEHCLDVEKIDHEHGGEYPHPPSHRSALAVSCAARLYSGKFCPVCLSCHFCDVLGSVVDSCGACGCCAASMSAAYMYFLSRLRSYTFRPAT